MGFEVLGDGDDASPDGRTRSLGGERVRHVHDLGAEAPPEAPLRTSSSVPGRSRFVVGAALLALVSTIGVRHESAPDAAPPAPAPTARATAPVEAVEDGGADLAMPVTVVQATAGSWPTPGQVAAVRQLLDGAHVGANLDVHPARAGDPVGVVADFDRQLDESELQRVAKALVPVHGPDPRSSARVVRGQTASIAIPLTAGPCLRGTGFNTAFAPPRDLGVRVDRLLAPPFQSYGARPGYAVLHYAGPARPRWVLELVGSMLADGCGASPADVVLRRGPQPAAH